MDGGHLDEQAYVEGEGGSLTHGKVQGDAENREDGPDKLVLHLAAEAVHEHPDREGHADQGEDQDHGLQDGNIGVGGADELGDVREVDTRDALDAVLGHYPEEDDAVIVQFSLIGGGAGGDTLRTVEIPADLLHFIGLGTVGDGLDGGPVGTEVGVGDGSLDHTVGGGVVVGYDVIHELIGQLGVVANVHFGRAGDEGGEEDKGDHQQGKGAAEDLFVFHGWYPFLELCSLHRGFLGPVVDDGLQGLLVLGVDDVLHHVEGIGALVGVGVDATVAAVVVVDVVPQAVGVPGLNVFVAVVLDDVFNILLNGSFGQARLQSEGLLEDHHAAVIGGIVGIKAPLALLLLELVGEAEGDARLLEGLRGAEVGGVNRGRPGGGGDQEEAAIEGEAEDKQEQGEGETQISSDGGSFHGDSPFVCWVESDYTTNNLKWGRYGIIG